MTSSTSPPAPNPQLPLPSPHQFVLFFVVLAWFAVAPILLTVAAAVLSGAAPTLGSRLLLTFLLAMALIVPTVTLTWLTRRQKWPGLQPLALALLLTALYLSAAGFVRAVSPPDSTLEAILSAIVLTSLALLVGGLGLRQAGVPGRMLGHAFGLERPSLAGVLVALAAVALVTMGWPITGALGDSWSAQMLLLRWFAFSLPEVIFFFGAVPGIITFNFQHQKWLAALMALLIYLASTLSKIVPHADWWALAAPITMLPLALLIIELRAFTGSLWPGLLFAVAYLAAPPLFTDARDELPLITQPWQTAARLWMLVSTAALTAILWAVRQFVAPRWRWPTLAVAAPAALLLWISWAGLWISVGYPGFYNDGFLIILQEQADLSGATAITDVTARRAFVRQRLIETARRTQPPVTKALDAAGLAYRQFYLINMIRVDASPRRMAEFAHLPGVARVMRNPNVRPYPLKFSLPYRNTFQEGRGAGWNIDQINAGQIWAQGVTGQGIVLAGQDTGFDWQHPALAGRYRGRDGDHNYDWHDAWGTASAPFDNDQHGTHTMGIMVGDDGRGNQIGVAPGAQWIGCRNMRRGIGNPASYTDCMEFFLAPYPLGSDPFTEGDVSMAPQVVNNSWGCPDREGCDDSVLQPAVAALRAAGILMVVSAGNDGPACETVTDPPARYAGVFSVGAADSQGRIAGFSSRGPVPPAEAVLKPDVVAPGVGIRSSVPGGGYALADGTSMAGPHVAGLVALLWSANPNLIGQIEATEEIIREATHPTPVDTACNPNAAPGVSLLGELDSLGSLATCACGGTTGVPNNVYGWGEVDALRAVQLAQGYKP